MFNSDSFVKLTPTHQSHQSMSHIRHHTSDIQTVIIIQPLSPKFSFKTYHKSVFSVYSYIQKSDKQMKIY